MSTAALHRPSHNTRPESSRAFVTRSAVGLSVLTLAVFLVHGYHPFTEDGGLYAVGAEWLLDRSLFPHGTVFVADTVHWSGFPWMVAGLARAGHFSLDTALLLVYLASIVLTLFAGRELLRRAGLPEVAQWAGVAMLAAWWSMPVAGTSLMLMDPYTTARSFATPLGLLAIAYAVDDWPRGWRSPAAWMCAASLAASAAFHPLMAGYAFGHVLAVRLIGRPRSRALLAGLAVLVLAGSLVLKLAGKPDAPAVLATSVTRYYWFLSEWQWYEWLGLIGPFVVLWLLVPRTAPDNRARRLLSAMTFLGALAVAVSLLFCHPESRSHVLDRLQPLRTFVEIYAVLPLLVGASLVQLTRSRRLWRSAVYALAGASAVAMFFVQRDIYANSPHLEAPWTTVHNPWVEAFLWIRANTPRDALFALDDNYITMHAEDAHLFRVLAQRNALSDVSKDGGEASAMSPEATVRWLSEVVLTQGLSQLDDRRRDARLRPRRVNWMVLTSGATTVHPCPYRNALVKVCTLDGAQ